MARTATFYPDDAVTLSIAAQRATYDRLCAAFDSGRPDGLTVIDEAIGAVPCRRYSPDAQPTATILYFHGGGFVLGGLESHDSICAEFADRTGFAVVSVDYPLAPEHPFPADFNAAVAVFDALVGLLDHAIILSGDSAGGNLAAALAQHVRGHSSVAGQLLIYPGLGGDWSLPSYQEHADAPGLTTRDMKAYMDLRVDGGAQPLTPDYAPLKGHDFSGLPPTVVISAECDPLASDGDDYVRKIQAAGGAAIWQNETGLIHGFLRARHMSQKARDSFERMIQSLIALRHGQLPTF